MVDAPESSPLPQTLRSLRTLLGRVTPTSGTDDAPLAQAARNAMDRLDRDLLPRTAGGATHLVVGIVGPNNAGKSALFNSLAGSAVSPSRATGGATRRLVGAACGALLARLEAEPTLSRFPLRRALPGPGGVQAAVESGGDPAELLLVEVDALEDGVLLVDTPDFDSIRRGNRLASEALLRVTDLAVVVVTRHTYQNREVVEFLESWLAHGRPWLLVYNESISSEVTAEHAAKLSADLGVLPVATFHAPFDMDVALNREELEPRALAAAPGTESVTDGERLGPWLFHLPHVHELKGRAMSASLAQLDDELEALIRALALERDQAEEMLARGRAHARTLGETVAGEAMPMGPFLEAFRAVLDRRPSLLQRGLRGALRKVRGALEGIWARLSTGRTASRASSSGSELLEIERAALEPAWPVFFEALAADLDPARGAHPVDARLAEHLAADLAPDASHPARQRAIATLANDPEVLLAFQEACEGLIEEEFAERGNEWFFQFAVDAVHLVPALAAGIVIVNTGGLGTDLAVGSAGALTTLLAERLSKLLGTRVAWRARERWTQLRGARLAQVALESALETSAPLLARRARERGDLSDEFRRTALALAVDTGDLGRPGDPRGAVIAADAGDLQESSDTGDSGDTGEAA